MIIAVGSIKGGVGKTTLALNIAVARALEGRNVWIVDADRQATAMTAASMRGERTPVLACAGYPDGKMLREQIKRQAKAFDDVVIDAGGRDSSALRAALILCDTLIIPLQPRSFDVWTLDAMAGLIDEARSVRDGLRAMAILNMADSTGQDNDEAIKAILEIPQLEYPGVVIRRRKAFANASGAGLSVLEARLPDRKAVSELKALINVVFS